ncbi:hypothetical protein DMENIID0001_038120 [Sergentomyia squamirostris]
MITERTPVIMVRIKKKDRKEEKIVEPGRSMTPFTCLLESDDPLLQHCTTSSRERHQEVDSTRRLQLWRAHTVIFGVYDRDGEMPNPMGRSEKQCAKTPREEKK